MRTNREHLPVGECFILLVTGLYALAHWLSTDIAELAKDSFEGLTQDWIPLSDSIQHRLWFALIGFSLSASCVGLARDFALMRDRRSAFLFGSLRLWLVLIATSIISASIFYYATVD